MFPIAEPVGPEDQRPEQLHHITLRTCCRHERHSENEDVKQIQLELNVPESRSITYKILHIKNNIYLYIKKNIFIYIYTSLNYIFGGIVCVFDTRLFVVEAA